MAGAVQETVAWVIPPTALTAVGTPGSPTGTTPDEVPATDIPTPLVAVTEKV